MSACATTGATTTPRPDPALEAPLRPLLPPGCAVAIAYSGGPDSTALLHVAQRVAAETGARLHALHVHHGLHAQADAWQAHAQARCAAWGVGFQAASVHVTRATREGLEAEARRLRYAALAQMAREAGCRTVLLAHHADDQAETWWLQALRGGGLAGLAAMPERRERDGLAWLRPWLGVRRAVLAQYLEEVGLSGVEDPSNKDPCHARNRLRLGPLPVLEQAFPGAVEAIGQVVRQAQEALECLRLFAEDDLRALRRGDGLDVVAWSALAAPRRNLALRTWLTEAWGHPPPRSLVQRLMHELQPGGPPRRWPAPQGALVSYRNVLSLDGIGPRRSPLRSTEALTGPPQQLCATAAGDRVEILPADVGVPRERLVELSWRERSGGEQFQLHRRGVPRSLKKCFQAAGVPAWDRDAPLLFARGELLFVPALGVDARHLTDVGGERVSLHWRPREPG